MQEADAQPALDKTQQIKFAPNDWHTSNFIIASSTERQHGIARDVRHQSAMVRTLTENTTCFTQQDSDTKLTNRIGDTTDWKDTLTKTLADTEKEIENLTERKERAERALEAKSLPLDVVLECLALREQRVSIDLVRDEVEAELQKELDTTEAFRSILHQRVNSAFEQICVLQKCHDGLCVDLTDKHKALGIDTQCFELGNNSDTISLQNDPTRIKKNIVTVDQWKAYSAHNASRAESEMNISVRLRESINQTIQQTDRTLAAQWAASGYALRKRIHEMEQTKADLEWQEKSTEREIAKTEAEIKSLKDSLALKTPPMMVAQTRLENRTFRPNVESCRDEPQYRMVEEVAQIADSQQSLQEKLGVAEQVLGALTRTLGRIQTDLDVKSHSLTLDHQCLLVREKLSHQP